MRNSPHKILLAFFLALCTTVFAQPVVQAVNQDMFTSKELRVLSRAEHFYKKKKYTKAIEKLYEVQRTHLLSEQLWRIRVEYEYRRYRHQYGIDAFGSAPEGVHVPKHAEYAKETEKQCRMATLYCHEQEDASRYLFFFNVPQRDEPSPSDEWTAKFFEGSVALVYRDSSKARACFLACYKMDTTRFSSLFALGDLAARRGEYAESERWYVRGAAVKPENWEVWAELADVRMKMENWDGAFDACVEGIIAYPWQGFNTRLYAICEKQKREFNPGWFARWNVPNSMPDTQEQIADQPWSVYRDVKYKLSERCDVYGFVEGNEGSTHYLEFCSWKSMVEQCTGRDELKTAYAMQENGNLDCYVFVSMFHISFYWQYIYFAAENKERIRQYIRLQLVK